MLKAKVMPYLLGMLVVLPIACKNDFTLEEVPKKGTTPINSPEVGNVANFYNFGVKAEGFTFNRTDVLSFTTDSLGISRTGGTPRVGNAKIEIVGTNDMKIFTLEMTPNTLNPPSEFKLSGTIPKSVSIVLNNCSGDIGIFIRGITR